MDTISPLGRSPARSVPSPHVASTPAALVDAPAHRPGLRGQLHAVVTENLGFKLLALILAVTVFLLVNTDRDREITARVGVSYTLPDGKVLVTERLDEIRINVRGPWRRLRRFDEREIDRVNLDLSRVVGGELAITANMIVLPPGLTLTSWSPHAVPVAFEQMVEKVVDISPIVVGRPLHGFVVSETIPVSKTVRVRGAAGAVAALTAIRTREIRVDGRSERMAVVALLAPPDGIEVFPPGPVDIDVRFEELLVSRHVGPLPVTLIGDAGSTTLLTQPAHVEVVLTGSLRAVEAAAALVGVSVHPTVRINTADSTRRHQATVTVEGLPAGMGVEIVPPRVQVGPRK